MSLPNEPSHLLLRLKGAFGNDLYDPELARIQEVEKVTGRLQDLLLSAKACENVSSEVLETRQFVIDTIQRDLLMIPKEHPEEFFRFLRDLSTSPDNPPEDPLDQVIAITTQLEAFLKEVLYDAKKAG